MYKNKGKIFITSSMKAILSCPVCERSREVDVSDFMSREKQVALKCKCKCGSRFDTILERRRSVRKPLSVTGRIRHGKLTDDILVKDISRHGMQLKLLGTTVLKTGERIGVEFRLDDPLQSIINRDLRVRKVIPPDQVGCEFLSFDHHGNLGKYFLFYN